MMSKELVIGSNRHETKVAILEDDQLVELYFQRANEYSLAGSIHKGRVTRVLPGMQSAFVDLGLERDTFLYVTDFFEENEDIDTVVDEKPVRDDRRDRDRDRAQQPRIPQRQIDDRLADVKEVRPPISESQLGDVPQVNAEAAPALSQGTGSVSQEPSGAEPPDPRRMGPRPEGDRNFGGDRRNRRSRRRRSRPNGIPENKYAQPTAGPGVRSAAPVVFVEQESAQDTSDVIILPGESLAKYRGVNVASARDPRPAPNPAPFVASTAEPEHHFEPKDDLEEAEPFESVPLAHESLSDEEREAEEQEAIEAEAAEIELSDKIFSHREDESVEAEEAKIEEVQSDTPPEQELESRAEAIPFEEPTSLGSGAEVQTPLLAEESRFSKFVEDDGPEEELVEANEFTAIASEEIAAEHAQTLAEELIASGGAQSSAESEPVGPQSASVRDQSGRVMHRASRRLRRRRGGSRMGQAPASDMGAAPSGESTLTSSAAGAAPALEPEARQDAYEERATEKPDRAVPSISDLLKAGQEIIVQIAKEPLGQKGARITSHIALPGRYVVFMPSVSHLGVSRKVASEEERQRLKRILQTHRVGTTGGFIVRTAGEGVPEEEIAADMNFLYTLWLDIRQKAEKKPAPMLLHYDLDVVQRILRDQITEEYKAIWVDNEEMYENVLNFMQRFQPSLVNRVKMYTRPAPIFDAFNITQELEKALRPKVWLKSGGYIVINQTEALVAIDINTGKYVGKSNRLEDTIVKTNTEAVKEIVRQIRLRDLGGIIVVDFIDMDERKNRQKVMQALEDAMRSDKAPYKILQFNDFGLVAITRKRVKQSLERTMCSPCPYCEGAGYVKSVQTVISEILVEAQKIARAVDGKDVLLRVHPEVAKVLKASNNRYLEELEEILQRPVLVTGDATVHHEKFDLA